MNAPARAPERHYTVAAAAELLSCSRQHVYDLVAAKRLTAVDISASARRTKLRIPQSALHVLLRGTV